MLNLAEIDEAINSLENENLTYAVCSKLSDLYTVKEHILNSKTDSVIDEYKDILPSYENYRTAKINYIQNNTSENAVISNLERLCKEISEFLHILYINTVIEEEKDIISNMIDDLKD